MRKPSLDGTERVPELRVATHVTGRTTPAPTAQTALRHAMGEVGVMEEPLGSNRGPRVDAYLRSVGIDPSEGGQPWCAAFVYWCFTKATIEAGVVNPAVRSASVVEHWVLAGRRGLRRVTRKEALSDPQKVPPGSVFVIFKGAGTGHMGFVQGLSQGILQTVEGNTNTRGTREGIGVFRRDSRRLADVEPGFVIY